MNEYINELMNEQIDTEPHKTVESVVIQLIPQFTRGRERI